MSRGEIDGRGHEIRARAHDRDWRWAVSTLGKGMISAGVLMLAFVAYLLWGTSIQYSQAQGDLDAQWRELRSTTVPAVTTAPTTSAPDAAEPPVTAPPTSTTAPTATAAPTTTVSSAAPQAQPIPVPDAGDVVARLTMPTIGVEEVNVVSGVGVEDLKKGPGHFPDTPLPGQLGNAALAGHRTTYGGPFHDIDELQVGDEIVVETLAGRYVYRMTGSEIVDPSQYSVIATTDPTRATLTLTSCHPLRSARQRIIVYAELDPASSAPVGAMTVGYAPVSDVTAPAGEEPAELPGEPPAEPVGDAEPSPTTVTEVTDVTADTTDTTDATTTNVDAASGDGGTADGPGDTLPTILVGEAAADAFGDGWFPDQGAWAHIAIWGAVLAVVAIGAHRVSRRAGHDWVGALVGIGPFLVVLYFFFQNVSRLLPPGF